MSLKQQDQTNKTISEVYTKQKNWGLLTRLKLLYASVRYINTMLRCEKEQDKIYRLSELRKSDVKKTLNRVIQTGFQLLPTNLDKLDFPAGGDTVADVVQVSPTTFKITTTEGMTFYDWQGSKKHLALYWLMRDKAGKFYSPNTFFAAAAVNRSFIHGIGRFPGDALIPKEGGVVIEAGSYVGYKAISFAKQVGETGKVVVIEASPENFELLVKNINENNLDSVATPIHCAVWNKNEDITLSSKGRMQHTVAETDELSFETKHTIQAKTLDTIIDEQNLERVDFLNLQLNGAEIEAIEGLQRNFNKVRYINIITRYKRDGELVVDIAKKMLKDRGCKIVVDSRADGLYNLTAEVLS